MKGLSLHPFPVTYTFPPHIQWLLHVQASHIFLLAHAHLYPPLTPCSKIFVHFLTSRTSPWRWRQQGPPKQRYLTYLLTYLLTYFMVQDILWKAESHSASQTISSFLYGIRRFITMFTKAPYPEPAESSSAYRSLSP